MEEQFSVTLEGGSPWGFSLQGGVDFRSPLRVARVTAGGKAAGAGLVAGDYILEINEHSSKALKHMQAQRLIKQSRQVVTLTCSKQLPLTTPRQSPSHQPANARPLSITSPTVLNAPISFNKPKSSGIARPKPPPVVCRNGVSTGRRSQSTSTGSPSPQTPHSNVDVYDVKFQRIYSPTSSSNTSAGSQQHAQQKQVASDNAVIQKSPPVHQDEVEVVQIITESKPLIIELPPGYAVSPPPGTEEAINGKGAVEEEEEYPPDGEFGELVEEMVEAVPLEETEAAVFELKFESPEKDGRNEVDQGVSPVTQEDETPQVPGEITAVDQPAPVVNDTHQQQQQSPQQQQRGDRGSPDKGSPPRGGPELFKKNAFASVLNAAAATHIVENEIEEPKVVELPPEPLIPAAAAAASEEQPTLPPPAGFEAREEEEEEVEEPRHVKQDSLHSSSGSSVEAVMTAKEPGWYQQMFQNFTNTVEEAFPGAATEGKAEEKYDSRGLRVRAGSGTYHHLTEENSGETNRAKSPEAPVYVYDHRGLRVRAGSVGAQEERPKATTAVEELKKDTRPKSATTVLSVAPNAREDVLAATKRPTNYKAKMFSTDGSRGYWKQKDQEHQETERKRRLSWDKAVHCRSDSSSSDLATHREEADEQYSSKMMHRLLRDPGDDEPEPAKQSSNGEQQQPELFDRIDPNKLQGALSNAGRMGVLEHEGVPSSMLPLKADEKVEQKPKHTKPPPGRKAKALFNFEATSPKELVLSKGDIVDLTHTVDDNWLEGMVDGKKGMFPTAYVKVLSTEEIKQLFREEPKEYAKALYDFTGQSDREISFKRGDILTVTNKVDANWYEGCLDESKGIFPTSYVEIVEGGQ